MKSFEKLADSISPKFQKKDPVQNGFCFISDFITEISIGACQMTNQSLIIFHQNRRISKHNIIWVIILFTFGIVFDSYDILIQSENHRDVIIIFINHFLSINFVNQSVNTLEQDIHFHESSNINLVH